MDSEIHNQGLDHQSVVQTNNLSVEKGKKKKSKKAKIIIAIIIGGLITQYLIVRLIGYLIVTNIGNILDAIDFWSLGYSEEEKEEMLRLETQASENAKKYLESKYGISAEVISTNIQKENHAPVPILYPDPTGLVYVNCKYDSKDFIVFISGETANIDGTDNYQKDEIVNDIENYFEAKTNLKLYSSDINYGKICADEIECDSLIKEKYNKGDLIDFINNEIDYIKISFIENGSLEYAKENDILDEISDTDVILINYNSQEEYRDSQGYYYNCESIMKDALNIESYYCNIDGNIEYRKIELKEIDGIYYYVGDSSGNYDVEISKTTIQNTEEWLSGGKTKIEQIYNAYNVKTEYASDDTRLYIYIPKNRLEKYENFVTSMGVECDGFYYEEDTIRTIGAEDEYYMGSIYLCDRENPKGTNFTIINQTY